MAKIGGIDRMHKMCIYSITNLINNKVYIGQTINCVNRRWQRHISSSPKGNSGIRNAIKLYGVDNFKFEVIDIGETIDQLNHKEQFWINYYNTISPNGYNLDCGGLNKIPSLETRARQSKSQKAVIRTPEAQLARNYGLIKYFENLSDTDREKLSLSHVGKTHTDETKQLQSIKAKIRLTTDEGINHRNLLINISRERIRTEFEMEKQRVSKTGKRCIRNNKNKNNTSGECGIFFRTKLNQQHGSWNANIYDIFQSKLISVSFGCKKYGNELAHNMAKEWRKNMEYNLKNRGVAS